MPSPGVAAIVRGVASRARIVTVPSPAVGADLDLRHRLGDRVRVIAPGVDMDRFAGIGAPPATPSVLVLGALASWKRPDLALEVAALARDRVPGLTMTIVGGPITADEAFAAQLRERASTPHLAWIVTLRGAVGDPRSELEAAACLLHCAPAEPFGIAILEALAAGRPVVVPDAGGPREIVDATCGELYPGGDASAAAQAIVRVLSDPARARAMGIAGRARVRANFTVESTRDEFRAALAGAVQPGASAR